MPQTSRKVALGLIFLTVFIDLLGFGLVLPLLPIYARELTADMSKAHSGLVLGSLMASFSLMQFLFAPLWGRLSDVLGRRRPVLLVGLAGSTAFYFLFGLASLWGSLWGMFLSRIGAGICGATIPTAQAYIADITPPAQRARGMALIGAAFGLGFTLGPLVGVVALLLSRGLPLSPWPGYLASVLSGIAFLLAWWKLPESYQEQSDTASHRRFDMKSLVAALRAPSIGLLLLTGFLGVFALAGFEGTISFTIRDKLGLTPSGEVAPDWLLNLRMMLVFAFIGLVQSLVQGGLVRALARRMTERSLAWIGAVLSIAGYLFLGLIVAMPSAAFLWTMVAVTIVVSGIAFLVPAVQALLSRRTDPARQGGILGVAESVSAIARITGVFVAMPLYQLRPALPFWLASALMVAVLVSVSLATASGADWEAAHAEP